MHTHCVWSWRCRRLWLISNFSTYESMENAHTTSLFPFFSFLVIFTHFHFTLFKLLLHNPLFLLAVTAPLPSSSGPHFQDECCSFPGVCWTAQLISIPALVEQADFLSHSPQTVVTLSHGCLLSRFQGCRTWAVILCMTRRHLQNTDKCHWCHRFHKMFQHIPLRFCSMLTKFIIFCSSGFSRTLWTGINWY